MSCFIVINEEEQIEMEFDDIIIARRTLVALVEGGIKASFVVESEYHHIIINKYDSPKSLESRKENI